MLELNMSFEYLPITKELKDVSSLKNKDVWLEQSGQDLFNNPKFQINANTTCIIQRSRDEKWYTAFIIVSEKVDNSYNNYYFKAFFDVKNHEGGNSPVYFDNFEAWEKKADGRWGAKRNKD